MVFHAGTAERDGARRDGGRPCAHRGRPRFRRIQSAIDTAYRAVAHVASTACSTGRTSGRRPIAAEVGQVKYAVVTFGCRVNQADSLEIEGALRSRAAASACPRRRPTWSWSTRARSPAAADQGARQTIRRVARENPAARIVVTGCYATRRARRPVAPARRRARGAQSPQGPWCSCPGRLEPGPGAPPRRAVCRLRTARAVHRLRPASRAARPSRCACRRAAISACSYCIIPRRAARDSRRRWTGCCEAVSGAVAAGYREIDAVRRAPRFVRAGPGATARRCRRCVRRSATGRPTCCFVSARSSRWTARPRSWRSWHRRPGSPRTSTCRCSTATTRCCARCAARTPPSSTKSW